MTWAFQTSDLNFLFLAGNRAVSNRLQRYLEVDHTSVPAAYQIVSHSMQRLSEWNGQTDKHTNGSIRCQRCRL